MYIYIIDKKIFISTLSIGCVYIYIYFSQYVNRDYLQRHHVPTVPTNIFLHGALLLHETYELN